MNRLSRLAFLLIALFALTVSAQEPASEIKPEDSFAYGEYNSLIQAANWSEAGAMLDAGLKDSPNSPKLLSLSLQLANRTMQAAPEAAEKRLISLVEHYLGSSSISTAAARELVQATDFLSIVLIQQDRGPEALNLMTKTLNAISAQGDSLLSSRRELEPRIARSLLQLKQPEEALKLMQGSIEDVQSRLASGTSDLSDLVRSTNIFSSLFRDIAATEVAQYQKLAEDLIMKNLNEQPDSLIDLSAYISLRSAQISALTYSDPERGMEMAKELSARIEAFPPPSDESKIKQLDSLSKNVNRMSSSLEASLARVRLVGTDAPEYEAQSFVGMEPTTLAQLRGKVVLLDFWAVWCGPCIATFPHLKEWSHTYGDKGFVILGLTSDQGFVWDEGKKRAVRGEDVSHEQELEMLESFRNHHELTHGFVLTPKGSDYNKQLAVQGIPQAVLLDQQGVIRMIKVGSGPQNAKALEDEIKKLLGITESTN
jgi:thiol-disulfide isomerase/thioredoxin